jgi:hypothetical protein
MLRSCRLGAAWAHFKSRTEATASRSVSNRSAYVSRVTFGSTQNRDLPWGLVIREVGEDRVHTHVVDESYSTAADAKEAAEQWRGLPLK